jgi:hypothetical protein
MTRAEGSCSRLLQGGGLGLLEEAGSGGLRLDVLGLLDDGLEPSTEGSNLGVVRHGDRTGQRTGNGCTVPRLGLAEAGKKLRL